MEHMTQGRREIQGRRRDVVRCSEVHVFCIRGERERKGSGERGEGTEMKGKDEAIRLKAVGIGSLEGLVYLKRAFRVNSHTHFC